MVASTRGRNKLGRRAVRVWVVALTGVLLASEVPLQGVAAAGRAWRSFPDAYQSAVMDPSRATAVEKAAIPVELPTVAGTGARGMFSDASIGLRPHVPAWAPPQTRTEQPSLRSEHGRVFAETNGTFSAEMSQARIHFQDASGAWNPLNLDLESTGQAPYGLRVAASDRSVRFSEANGESAMVELGGSAGTIRLRAIGYASASARQSGERLLRFPGSANQGEAFVVPTDKGFEYGVSIDRNDRATVYHFVLDTGALTATLNPDGSLVLRDAAGATAGVITLPVLLDGGGAPAPASAVTVALTQRGATSLPADIPAPAVAAMGGNEVMLTYRIDPTWLHSPDRTFPVVLDPDACIGHQASGCDLVENDGGWQWFISSGAQPATSWTVMRTGYDTRSDDGANYGSMRSMWYFPDVTLPTPGSSVKDGGQITSATMSIEVGEMGGNPGGKVVNAYGINKGWGVSTAYDWGTHASGYDSTPVHSKTIASDIHIGNNVAFTVTDIVRTWFNRRGADWKPNIGIFLKFATENSTNGELDFRRWGSETTSNSSPKLTINYTLPKVTFDFDPSLGPTYAPSSMVAGRPTVLPLLVKNNGSGFDFTTSAWKIGYRWFDADNKVVNVGTTTQSLPSNLTSGATQPTAINLGVTPPSTPGQYTLRLDMFENSGSMYTSDWVNPALYYSRDKKVLTSDNTRWTGSSRVERAEFSINIVRGGGTNTGFLKQVTMGTGDTLGINPASGNLHFEGDSGLGFKDLINLGLRYGYDSNDTADCTTYKGILGACGWYTQWDERFIAGSEPEQFTYIGPTGNRYLASLDPDGHLTSGAGVAMARQRYTAFDENVPTNSPTASLIATPAGVSPAPSGNYVISVSSASAVTISGLGNVDLKSLPNVRFSVRTTSAANAAIGFRIENITNPAKYPPKWIAYTIGSGASTSGDPAISANGSNPSTAWRAATTTDLYADAIANGMGKTGDSLRAINMKTYANGSGTTYIDAVRFVGTDNVILDVGMPTWTSGSATTSPDAYSGANSFRVSSTASPVCNNTGTPCFSASAGHLERYPFVTWAWKKLGQPNAAIVLYLKDLRNSATGQITYYAGEVPPSGATNPVQVSDQTPEQWTRVTRNVLRDAQQILNFFNSSPSSPTQTSEDPPAQGPVGDYVQITGYKLSTSTIDGVTLFDNIRYRSAPEPGSTSATTDDDFVVTNADLQKHYFNRDGMLTRVVDADGNLVRLDYNLSTFVSGQSAYTLTAIRAPTDSALPGGSTYSRYLEVTRTTGSPFNTVKFTEKLTSPATGRSATFHVSSVTGSAAAPGLTYPTNALVYVNPARNDGGSCTGARPTGCIEFDYAAGSPRVDEVRDPRWTGLVSGNDRWWLSVAYTGNDAYAIDDKSRGSVSLIYVSAFDRLPVWTPPAAPSAPFRIAVVQDSAMRAANKAQDIRLGPDGSIITEYVPKPCTGSCSRTDSATWPALASASDAWRQYEYDGVTRVNKTTTFRNPGADPVISRQASKAGAKVDNYGDALQGGEVAWSQTPDQHFASLRDSAGKNPDLYRTTFAYDAVGRTTAVATPIGNLGTDYKSSVLTNATATDYGIQAYWRLNDTGSTAADIGGTAENGTISATGVTKNQSGALLGSSDKAMTFDGSTGRITAPVQLGDVGFTMSAWVNERTAYTTGERGIVGDWLNNDGAMLSVLNGKLAMRQESKLIDTGIVLAKDRWYHVVGTFDLEALRVYLDGVLVGTVQQYGTTGTGATNFEIASHSNNLAGSQNNATIDEVSVLAWELQPREVQQLYAAGRGAAMQTIRTVYDGEGHALQVDDLMLADGGFEALGGDWSPIGFGSSIYQAAAYGDSNVVSGLASLKTGLTASRIQDAQLVPGQTFRFQLYEKRTGTATAEINLDYWNTATQAWTPMIDVSKVSSSWASHAWDVTLPMTTDGRVRATLGTAGGTGTDTVYYDDVALLTTYARTGYRADGLVSETATFSPASDSAFAEIVLKPDYVAATAHPGIFATASTANYVLNGPSTADTNVVSTTEYDAWGRTIKTTDADGVDQVTTYKSSAGYGRYTDIEWTADGDGKQTKFTYGLSGHRLTTTTPQGRISSTTYDMLGRPDVETAGDGTLTDHNYNGHGFEQTTISNAIDGIANNDGSLIDDVIATRTTDEFGRVTRVDLDDGLIDQVTTTSYDLLGNVTATTVNAGPGATLPRTTTSYFETTSGVSRGAPTGTRGPIAPTSGALCPGSALYCNSVSTLDLGGRPSRITDSYGKATVTYLDLGGNPTYVIANYVNGVPDVSKLDSDLISRTEYDILGRAIRSTDVAGRVVTTTYDGLGRATLVTKSDGSFAKTVFTPGGRTDRASSPAAAGTLDVNLTWTKSLYDAAGRLATTIGHYDVGTAARSRFAGFEERLLMGWNTTATTFVPAAGATLNTDDDFHGTAPRTGRGRLRIDTNAASNGVWWDLAGPTWLQGHTYRLQADVKATAGPLRGFFGLDAAGSNFSEDVDADTAGTQSLTTNGSWQTISISWSPSTTTSGSVHFALRKDAAGATKIYLDNVRVWDVAEADWNIPSTTVYSADGDVIASVLPPGAPQSDRELVTGTTYDQVGRATAVSTNATIEYSHAVAATAGLLSYWALDELGGVAEDVSAATRDLTVNGGVMRGVAGGPDEARGGYRFDGSATYLSTTSLPTTAIDNIALEAWFRYDATPTANSVIAYNGDVNKGWGLMIEADGSVGVLFSGVGTLDTGLVAPAGAWHHARFERLAGVEKLYLDGVDRALTNTNLAPIAPSGTFSVGRYNDAAGYRYFNGDIDEVAVYATPTTIGDHYAIGHRSDAVSALTTRTSYDGLGQAVAGWDPLGTQTRAVFDRLGRNTSTTLNYLDGSAAGPTTADDVQSRFAYNAVGELTAYCPANLVQSLDCTPATAGNEAWHFAYNDAGQLVTQTPVVNTGAGAAVLAEQTWTYDAGGRLTTTAAAGRHIDYTYDAVGRELSRSIYATAGTGAFRQSWTSTYSQDGLLTSVAWNGTGETPSLGTDTLTMTYDGEGRPDLLQRSGVTLTDSNWSADGTLLSRVDGTGWTTNFTYDWADRLAGVTNGSAYSGSIDSKYRLDGLLGSRTMPNGETASFGYDAGKRPTTATYSVGGSLSQTYDRLGNVRTETRSLSGVTGDAGTGTQSFTYDALSRVLTSDGLAGLGRSYSYDRNGNRLTKVVGSTTTTYTYDRTDQLTTQKVGAGATKTFAYDTFGNLATGYDDASNTITYTYDAANRLVSLAPASGSAATFTFDAFGRNKTRNVGSTQDTYSYVGSTETVQKIATTSPSSTLTSVIDATGSRLTLTGGSLAYAIPDLHGSTAMLQGSSAAISATYRFDAWGETLATYPTSGAPANPFKYRGLLDVSPGSTNPNNATPLYDMNARYYAPTLGTFTSMDTVRGDAADPLSLNRYLYAQANPATLIDPSGHMALASEGGGCSICSYTKTSTSTVKVPHQVAPETNKTVMPSQPRSDTTVVPMRADNWQADVAAGKWPSTAQIEAIRASIPPAPKDCGFLGLGCAGDAVGGLIDEGVKAVSGAASTAVNLAGSAINTVTTVATAVMADPSTAVHLALGVASMVPGLGTVTSLVDAGLYALEGDMVGAGMSLAGAIPFAGIAAGAAKLGKLATKVTTLATTAVKAEKVVDAGATAASTIAKVDGLAGSATKLKPLIIGEDMNRVRKYADEAGGLAWKAKEGAGLSPLLARNKRMIKDAMREGRDIIDIGPAFARRQAGRDPSIFYNTERMLTKGYEGYSKVFERWGKFEGGVPGLDF